MSNHPEEGFLKLYASNNLPSKHKRRVVEHLEVCQECRFQVSRLRQVGRRLRELERAALSHAVRQM